MIQYHLQLFADTGPDKLENKYADWTSSPIYFLQFPFSVIPLLQVNFPCLVLFNISLLLCLQGYSLISRLLPDSKRFFPSFINYRFWSPEERLGNGLLSLQSYSGFSSHDIFQVRTLAFDLYDESNLLVIVFGFLQLSSFACNPNLFHQLFLNIPKTIGNAFRQVICTPNLLA